MRFLTVLAVAGALVIAGCSDESSNGIAPVVTNVAWEADAACDPDAEDNTYTITVTATDADGVSSALMYRGDVTDCIPDITTAVTTATCVSVSPPTLYEGGVVVEDADGNASDTAEFTMELCGSSSCQADPTACNL